MKKKVSRRLSILLAFVMLLSMFTFADSQKVNAANNNAAPAYNNNYTYYSVYNTIYKLDSKTGKSTEVFSLDDAFYVFDISYYNGYLYFCANFFLGTGGDEQYICRVRKDGTEFQKLCRGTNPIVYGGKVYFTKVKHMDDFDTTIGIGSMSLNGRDSKTLLNCKEATLAYRFAIVSDKIVFIINDNEKCSLKQYDLKNKKIRILKNNNYFGYIISYDKSNVYYSANQFVECFNVAKKTGKKIENTDQSYFGGKDGKIYYSDYEARRTYEYNFNTGKKKLIKKNVFLYDVVYSKSGYNIYYNSLAFEEYQKNGMTTEAASMKANGKGYRSLRKYYES